jgi:ribosome modulation factor
VAASVVPCLAGRGWYWLPLLKGTTTSTQNTGQSFCRYGRILDFVDFAIHSGESCPFCMPVFRQVWCQVFYRYGRILDFVGFAIHSGESCPFCMPVFRQVWCQVFLRTFGVPDRRFMLSLIKISVSVYTRSY